VFGAYGHSIPKGDRPFYVLFLDWDVSDFDVNVHPTKAEVKFRDDQQVYRTVYHAVVDSMNTDALIPQLTPEPNRIGAAETSGLQAALAFQTERVAPVLSAGTPADEGLPPFNNDSAVPLSPEEARRDIQRQLLAAPVVSPTSLVWQLHNRYIVSQIKSGLAIIDQHVAHERILYERALDAFERNPIFSQQLLFPQTIEFTTEEFAVVEQLLPLVEKLGFVVRVFGSRTVVVEAVPADVRLGNEQRILGEMIANYRQNENASLDPRDNLAKSFACKSAIKSGDPLNVEEMNGLIDQLFATRFPYVCPHGRPVIIQLSLDELDRRFMRTT
jgi:DNA mismatch repair protein MutL